MRIDESRLEPGRGRDAEMPSELPWRGWKDILWRVYSEFVHDRITLIAAGATFYLLLALFPALAAFVSLYGFVADPVTIADHIAFLGGILPTDGFELIRSQLESLAQQNNAALSFGFIFGLLFALWSANNGIKTLFEALNVVYEEREKRSFVKVNLVSFVFTLGTIFVGILFIVSVGVVPALFALVGLDTFQQTLISTLRWPVLIVASTMAISLLYRFGPSREYARWRWISWGSALATLLWVVASVLFSWYLANFADYNATYGSLGAVIGFMMWTWISVVILLVGAEINAEMEHQTARDSTTGPPQPMGLRGATMADTLGRSRSEGYQDTPKAFDPSQKLSHHPDDLRPPEKPKPQQSKLGTVLGFALPAAVLGGVAAMELLDRRKPKPSKPNGAAVKRPRTTTPPRNATATAAAVSAASAVVRGTRGLLESPAGREIFARVLRAAPRNLRR